ncbi:hypothetical protein [Stutzerimonas frequens]|uniref:hypothetical protein n=1 Tax=Stutzerimonas frequens TaxID=2968969 RepID=UPI001F26876B|nr:hypothetical protein [Stutzerimonas frequens]
MSFIELCLAGEAAASDIDRYVAKWHAGEAGHDQTLPEYLGMTWLSTSNGPRARPFYPQFSRPG